MTINHLLLITFERVIIEHTLQWIGHAGLGMLSLARNVFSRAVLICYHQFFDHWPHLLGVHLQYMSCFLVLLFYFGFSYIVWIFE